MGEPSAKQGDRVTGTDTHVVLIPSPGGPVPTPTPMPFAGILSDALSPDVLIENMPAATDGSVAVNTPPHVPAGGPFQTPPSNQGKVQVASRSVLVNDKPAARSGDPAMTCNDPADAPAGTVTAGGSVLIGD
jgi:uncharacterized Zn-binding protein involved in type VI secretion